MQLDTDEYLDPDIDELVEFLTGPQAGQFDVATIGIKNYNSFSMDGDYSLFTPSRLYHRTRERKFVGAVHEVIPIFENDRVFELHHTVLHHDGYANEMGNKKARRNLPLLKTAFEKDPQNLRCLTEILDVCTTVEQFWQYAPQALELAHQQPQNLNGAIALRRVVQLAWRFHCPEASDWAQQARALFPDAPFINIDVSYYMLRLAAQSNEFAKVLDEAAQYWQAIRRYDNGEYLSDFFRYGAPYCATSSSRAQVHFYEFEAHYKLDQPAESLAVLELLDCSDFSTTSLISIFVAQLARLWCKTEIDGVPELLARQWQSLVQDDSRLADERRKRFCLSACSLLDQDPDSGSDDKPELRPLPQLFAALGPDCPAGLAAMILEAPDETSVRRLLMRATDWELVPARVLDLALMMGIPLPDSFYRSNSEVLQSHAAGLCKLRGSDAPQAALDWAESIDEPTPGQLMWLYDLTLSAMLGHDWRAESDQSVPLCELFLTLVELWLDTFYNSNIICDEMIHLLPATLRFGWHFLQAQSALNAGDPIEYVRRLRLGLQTAPSMKELVRFLSAQADASRAQPSPQERQELMELARAVRERVAELRAAGDPAADAIVQSEQYQLLLPFIEGPDQGPQS